MAEDVKAPDIPDGGKNTPNIDNHSESENATEVLVGPEGGSKDEDANGSAHKIPRSSPSVFEVRKSLAVTTRRLRQLLRNSAGQDCILASIEYLAHALHYLAASPYLIKLRNALTSLIYRRKGRNTQTAPNRLAWDFEEHSTLLNLSILFSNARYTLRLLGLFNIWTEVPGLFQSPVRDRLIRCIDVAQIFTITIYQLLENIGNLASNRVLSSRVIGSKVKMERVYIWSARALFLHFALEIMKLIREAQIARLARAGSKEEDLTLAQFDGDALGQDWVKRLWASSIWGLLCLYWSYGQAVPLVEETSGGFSFLADFFMFRDAWVQTRQYNLM
ncbi:hypothetical protein ASPVEDRAFT_178229 [Aspergillus versicolor CBS 583.65]|uniref:Uncharacterized protein n=1 Tax=Aspergillus versicolor CBS 583.65 TaxID=1036611 RepID=A0A1L9Q181_ASPVE|nr:uncharacterized protein ASPVEDRAFT_178229 [Aspergillus versicolor CBS 583.65]OJJ07535.1 hypothetical protein ASPVEDRAFT_178229 [Aspergillus versicolor CBS 583.65]